MPERRISIITDFGCRRSCPYCIWKGHRLAGNAAVAGWDAIEEALASSRCGSVSVSGGGDPLFGAGSDYGWWRRLFDEARATGKAVHVHTREIPSRSVLNGLAKVVFSTEKPARVPVTILKAMASHGTGIRLAKVILPDTTRDEAERYLAIAEQHGWQMTFKELTDRTGTPVPGTPFRGLESEMAGNYAGLRFLASGDYNRYLMPDGHVYTRFRALPEDMEDKR